MVSESRRHLRFSDGWSVGQSVGQGASEWADGVVGLSFDDIHIDSSS